MSHGVVAIIPARGGSKGIPGKNLVPIAGVPMLVRSIDHARSSATVDHVVVSTDDAEIAAAARAAGAEVVERPAELATDTATSESALLHALDAVAARTGEPDLVVFLQVTSPLRRPTDIDDAVGHLRRTGADSLFSASALHAFLWQQSSDELTSVTYDYRSRQRRQDRDVVDWVENGSIYVFKPDILRQHGNRLGGRIAVYEMPAVASFQVDEPDDLAVIEAMATTHPDLVASLSRRPTVADLDLLVFDFDGVMTDNAVYVSQDGVESVRCDRGDGLGIDHLRAAGLDMAILSTETNPVVATRAAKLRLDVVQASRDKASDLATMVAERGHDLGRVAFVGNDVNDLEAMALVGHPVAVADAVPAVRRACPWVTQAPGGRGAVREIAETLLRS